MSYKENYEEWRTSEYFDERTRQELDALSHDPDEIYDRFYKYLEFGTGGLRGILGAGTNRMNIYTVRLATQGVANYILSQNKQKQGVAIAFDSRMMSREFAREAALCFNANGIKTYSFDILKPTPELSFAVIQLKCIAGIVITASHNPKEYNGYKVYWEDGAQITSPIDQNIMEAVSGIKSWKEVKTMPFEAAVNSGLYHIIDSEIDDQYVAAVKNQRLYPDLDKNILENLKVVYTPLHGTGNIPINRILKESGFTNVYVVEEQREPDGLFSTVASPNPEEESACELALNDAKKVDADIVIATDPDADRLGAYVKDNRSGDYIRFNGNMLGVLIAEYIMQGNICAKNKLANPIILKTIVTTNMINGIARQYGVCLKEVLTGFKYIGEQIKFFEKEKTYDFLFGFEESYGCLLGTYTRDKDACVAALIVCEMAAFYKSMHKTLWDIMLELYDKYGYYKESLVTCRLDSKEKADMIYDKMNALRSNMPEYIGNFKVTAMRDYFNQVRISECGDITPLHLPKSNVLYFELEHDFWCCVRFSGTEAKIKYYYGVKGISLEDADTKLEELTSVFDLAHMEI